VHLDVPGRGLQKAGHGVLAHEVGVLAATIRDHARIAGLAAVVQQVVGALNKELFLALSRFEDFA